MRYKLVISYDGTNYSGYQRQKDKITIQQLVEETLSNVTKTDIVITASGRTDAGVSAIEQVCHFDADEIDTKRVMSYANTLLPSDIKILSLDTVSSDFHARYSAKNKTYEYMFYISPRKVPVYDKIASHIGYNINVDNMRKACEYFKGKHDFSAFCASNTNVKDKVRIIYNIEIVAIDEMLYKLVITGNGFLYNMVRIIMGTLSDVGMGKIQYKDIEKVITSKDRSQAGKTASPKCLYLKKVEY